MTTPGERVTRDDLENKFRSLQREVTGVAEEKRSYVVAGAVGSGVLALVLAYVMGRRRGRRGRARLDR